MGFKNQERFRFSLMTLSKSVIAAASQDRQRVSGGNEQETGLLKEMILTAL